MSNHLENQTSPYLLQHSQNPVDWYPWCDEAFQKAENEDKPIFLSIGYSTCHWCHVMSHESFEDPQTADILNRFFISIKVDKEERPDIDSVYMTVCQALTGSGGWPTSIFMTHDQKPFFAGTYFPKTSHYGLISFKELLSAIHEKWINDRTTLLDSADKIVSALNTISTTSSNTDVSLINMATELYKNSYDNTFGGFGDAPKFPAAHNLLFLLSQYEKTDDYNCLEMAETTLLQMYRGGIFDHIGFGFCRYSTDKYFLVPHFEKMLYDNALLILAYCKLYCCTNKQLYLDIAEKTAAYILREMTSPDGAFYSAQDADSDGEEGKYYVFEPSEIISILGKETGSDFNKYYGITKDGNFDGKSIPNLLQSNPLNNDFESCLSKIYDYRKKRNKLHLDDKILTSWNSLMIAAMCSLYRVSKKPEYLRSAKKAQRFIEKNLCCENTLCVSFRNGKCGKNGFLDDYANYIFALLHLYDATLNSSFLEKSLDFTRKVIHDFYDEKHGGFFLYGNSNENLIMKPKETYDGAMPSGNSIITHNLVRLFYLTSDPQIKNILHSQLNFMCTQAKQYSSGYAMFMLALSDYFQPPAQITVIPKNKEDLKTLSLDIPLDYIIKVADASSGEYQLNNGKTTFYICKNNTCLPPVNTLNLCNKNSVPVNTKINLKFRGYE